MSAICARPSQKEVGVKRVETLVSTLLPRRGARRIPALRRAQLSAEIQQKRLPPGQGDPPARFKHPSGSVQKRSRPLRANTLTQFVCPAESVPRKKENPLTKVL